MSRTIICLVGTSMFFSTIKKIIGTNTDERFETLKNDLDKLERDRYNRLKKEEGKSPSRKEYKIFFENYKEKFPKYSSGKTYYDELLSWTLKKLKSLKHKEFNSMASAELATLNAYLLKKEGKINTNKIILIASDTLLGESCANFIKDLIAMGCFPEDYKIDKTIIIERVEDLDVELPKEMSEKGLPKLTEVMNGYINDAKDNGDDVLLNVTGGYKITIPYAMTVASDHNIKIIFKHERLQKDKDSDLAGVMILPPFKAEKNSKEWKKEVETI